MKLKALMNGLPVQLAHGEPTTEIASIVDDSRRVTPGALFVARAGTKANGEAFIDEAIRRGAVAVLAGHEIAARSAVATLVASDVAHTALEMADRLLGRPGEQLTLLGVTGTNGKSTTTWLIGQILAAAGMRCGMVSTTTIADGSAEHAATMTTPGALELRSLLASMVRHGCTHAAVEVSSHAIDQGRIAGLPFEAAVFTNLSGDHLDYHKTMDAYAAAKARLFERLAPTATAIVSAEDPESDRMVRDCTARVLRCSTVSASGSTRAATHSECVATVLQRTIHSTRVRLEGPWGVVEAVTPLVGSHNIMNMLEAAAACAAVGADAKAIKRAVESAKAPPGRLERVTTGDEAFTVLVDYSHTDGALEAVLKELKPLVQKGGRLRTVFGCGGDRDTTKRPRMAKAALRFSDDVVITSDNPRSEKPRDIIEQILRGVPASEQHRVLVEEDRRKAITLAIERCRPGDVLVIAGKGHETYQIVGDVTLPFDDREVARQAIEAVRESSRAAMT